MPAQRQAEANLKRMAAELLPLLTEKPAPQRRLDGPRKVGAAFGEPRAQRRVAREVGDIFSP